MMDNISFKINSEQVYNDNISGFISLNKRWVLPSQICDKTETNGLLYMGSLFGLFLIEIINIDIFKILLLALAVVVIPIIFEKYKTSKITPYLEIIYMSLLMLGIGAIQIIRQDYFIIIITGFLYVLNLFSINKSNETLNNFKGHFNNYFGNNEIVFKINKDNDYVSYNYQVGDINTIFTKDNIKAIYFNLKTDDCFFILNDIVDSGTIQNIELQNYIYLKTSALIAYLGLDKNDIDYNNEEDILKLIKLLGFEGEIPILLKKH